MRSGVPRLLATVPIIEASADGGISAFCSPLGAAADLVCDSPVRAVEKVSVTGSDSVTGFCDGLGVLSTGSAMLSVNFGGSMLTVMEFDALLTRAAIGVS